MWMISQLRKLFVKIWRTDSASHSEFRHKTYRRFLGLYSSIMMRSHIISTDNPFPASFLHEIASHSPLDEISNIPGAVRHHIFWRGHRDRETGRLESSMLFFVYQTTRHGPQSGFRLCLIHRGFFIKAETKDEEPEDEIDRLEMEIPQGHMEVVILSGAPDPEAPDPAAQA